MVVGLGSCSPAGSLCEEVAILPLGLRVLEKGDQAAPFDLTLGKFIDPGNIGQRGKKINVGGDSVNGLACCEFAWPANEEGHANPAFVGRAF